jgi:hypothetical protein
VADPNNMVLSVDKHKTLLLIGAAATMRYLNELTYFETQDTVDAEYGGALAAAYKDAKKLGAKYVFTLNVRRPQDYIIATEILKQYDFTYIAPISVFAEDSYYDADISRNVTYSQLFVEQLAGNNDSTIIMTGPHASSFETLDDMIDNLRDSTKAIRRTLPSYLPGQNLAVIANNLKDFNLANVAIAGSFCGCEINEEPIGPFGDAIFDIDLFDVVDAEFGFFKNNTRVATSAEHLINFCAGGPIKLVEVDRVVKYIKRELDMSGFIGRLFSEYTRMKIQERLENFLEAQIDYVIDDYEIGQISHELTESGAIRVIISFSIWPRHAVEKVDVITSQEGS